MNRSVSAVTTTEERGEAQTVRAAGPDPLVGLTVADRYRILGPIGSGGMGVVYKVEHVRMGKLMAMKLLAGELSRDPALVKRFKREAQLASRLSHPNTVQVFDFGQADGLTYLVMELVPGDDLSKIVRNDGAMTFIRMARLVVQVCGSLAEAHGHGIVHRDLKPENVLVLGSPDGKNEIAKVCDFGLAKLREAPEANDVTSHGAVVGTPYYMSPEQIRGEDVDPRTDIYALGAVMYRLLTGSPPFTGPNPMAVFAKHLTEKPAPPSERSALGGISRAVDALVLKTLEKRRDDRFGRVEEIQEELISLLRAGNVSQVDVLLDSGQLREMQRENASPDTVQLDGILLKQAATRDEVEAFERKLRNQRRLGQVFLTVAGLAVVAIAARAYGVATADPGFDGQEREPNNDAAKANAIPFGHPVTGYVGKRISAQTSDRDFYSFDVPEGIDMVRLRTTAIPNFATCTLLYRSGMADPMARFCSGAPGRDLDVGALRISRGRYLIAVLQDVDSYGNDIRPPVFENVSDPYTLSFLPAPADPALEIEPNEGPVTANRVAVGTELRGALSFVRDVDTFCPEEKATGTSVRWVIKDAVDRPREAGAVLEVSLDRGIKDALRTVVHRPGVNGPPTAQHVIGAFTTPSSKVEGTTGCIQLRLVLDPWVGNAPRTPPAGSEPYMLRLEAAP
jgi:eukaryotic-like serine/threonine-protein kinase